jgi:hypothetical protein
MVAGSVMVAGVAVFGCLIMASAASVSAQQIGNSQGPSDAPSTPGTGKPTRATPAPLVIACSGAFARDSHHLKLTMTYDRKNVDFGEVDAGPGKSMAAAARFPIPLTASLGLPVEIFSPIKISQFHRPLVPLG